MRTRSSAELIDDGRRLQSQSAEFRATLSHITWRVNALAEELHRHCETIGRQASESDEATRHLREYANRLSNEMIAESTEMLS
jgi:hypothetical protein